MLIYSNPFDNSLTIDFEVKSPGIVKIEIYDVIGNLVNVLLLEYKLIGEYPLFKENINYIQGLYLIKYLENNNIFIQKIIKQNL